MDQYESGPRRLTPRGSIKGLIEEARSHQAEWEAYKKLGRIIWPAGPGENTGFDAAFGVLLVFSIFGAGLAFSALYAVGGTKASSLTAGCLAWAFAFYVLAASSTLGLRLWFNAFKTNDHVPMQGALMCTITACIVGTILMALSLPLHSHSPGVLSAGGIVALMVVYQGLSVLFGIYVLPFLLFSENYCALEESRRDLSNSSSRTAPQLPYRPTEEPQAEIERFLDLYSQFGNAFTYLDRRGNDNSEMAKLQKSPFQHLPREEMANRLAYASLVFGGHMSINKNGALDERLLKDAREFVAPEMRKWDPIIEQLSERGGGAKTWWRRPLLFQVMMMWWLFQAHGGADPTAQPLNAAAADPGSPQPEAGTVASIDYGDGRSMIRDAHGNIGDGASLRSEHPTRQTPRSSASSTRSLTSVRQDGQSFERHSMESRGREMLGQQQMPRNAGRISPLPSLSDCPV